MSRTSAYYQVMLYDPKGEMISKKVLRVYPSDCAAAEMLGRQIGFELGRDAFADMTEEANAVEDNITYAGSGSY